VILDLMAFRLTLLMLCLHVCADVICLLSKLEKLTGPSIKRTVIVISYRNSYRKEQSTNHKKKYHQTM